MKAVSNLVINLLSTQLAVYEGQQLDIYPVFHLYVNVSSYHKGAYMESNTFTLINHFQRCQFIHVPR